MACVVESEPGSGPRVPESEEDTEPPWRLGPTPHRELLSLGCGHRRLCAGSLPVCHLPGPSQRPYKGGFVTSVPTSQMGL